MNRMLQFMKNWDLCYAKVQRLRLMEINYRYQKFEIKLIVVLLHASRTSITWIKMMTVEEHSQQIARSRLYRYHICEVIYFTRNIRLETR